MDLIVGCAGAILKDKKILLTKRVSSKEKFPGYWTFPSGGLEKSDKSVEDCAIREVKEEVNLDFKPTEKLGFYETKWNDKRIFSLVFLGKWKGKVKFQKDEISEVGWFTYKEAKKLKIAFSYSLVIEDLHKKGLL